MLSLRQLDSIVHSNLRVFKGFAIENRREEGTYIFYDVYDNPKSKKRFIGTYQVWEWHDGSGRSGWVPQDGLDSEVEGIRDMVWNAIMAIAIPANQSTEHSNTQSIITNANTQGGTVGYYQNEQGQTVITGGTVNPGYKVEIGQGVAIKAENAQGQGV